MKIDGLSDKESKFKFRSCLRKIRYPDLASIPQDGRRPYECPFCSGWHLSSKRIADYGSAETFAVISDWPGAAA